MRKLLIVLAGALIFVFLMTAGREEPLFPGNKSDIPIAPALGSVKVNQNFGQMPLYFIPNKGQVAAPVEYYVQGKDKTIYFTSEGLTYVLNRQGDGDRKDGSGDFGRMPLSMEKEENELHNTRSCVVKLSFVGSNSDIHPSGKEKTEAVISYFKGRPEEWRTGLPTYSRIIYRDLWPGIDLLYYGTMDRLKYEFIVHPGADPSHIKLAYSGVNGLEVNGEGRLEVSTPVGVLEDDVPKGYQEVDGKKGEVALKYWLEKSMIEETGAIQDWSSKKPCIYGFEVGEYDRTKPLVLDPAVLIYCGYIGGSDSDYGKGIAVDSSGNAYVTGYTLSTEATFPETVGPDLTFNGGTYDAFVAKVNSTGTTLLYCGYIGGSDADYGYGIAVDGSGNAYVTGYTWSNEATFPVSVGPDLTFNGGDWDAFVAKVNSTGMALLYCGYIGGSDGRDAGNGIAVDSSGNAYVTGDTTSTEATFPATVGPDLTFNGGADAFVAKVNSTGTTLLYCGYIGGSDVDTGYGIAVDSSGDAYVTGITASTEATFPATVGPDLTSNGGADAFVAKVNSTGTTLLYCGYIGGSDVDTGYGIAVDGAGNAYVTGLTWSNEATFPVTVGPDLTSNGGTYWDAYVAKVNSTGTMLLYCGYIGGTDEDCGNGIAVDTSGNAYVTGYTESTEATFPVTVGPDLTFNGVRDAFVAKVNSTGTALLYCGYIGGLEGDYGNGIAVDSSEDAYVTGITGSTEGTFPVSIGPDLTPNGGSDAFVAKISAISIYTLTITAGTGGTTDPAPGTYAHDTGTQVTVTAVANSGYKFSGWSGDASGTTNPITITMDGDKSVTANFIRQYTLTIAAGTGGTTNPSPGTYTYDSGAQVSITATANSGYQFSGWSGSASGTTNPITITMDSDKSVTANFTATSKPSDGGKKGGCFIATAAYGSALHSHVNILRDFKDKYLIPTKVGNALVKLYYKYSPFVADLIVKHKALKFVIRVSLLPFVAFSYSMVHFGAVVTTILIVFLSLFPVFFIQVRKKRIN